MIRLLAKQKVFTAFVVILILLIPLSYITSFSVTSVSILLGNFFGLYLVYKLIRFTLFRKNHKLVSGGQCEHIKETRKFS